MRSFLENSFIMIGIVVGVILFVVGVRRALKAREPRTAADKILIAASITILSLMPKGIADDDREPMCYDRADPRVIEEDPEAKINKRFVEIKASKEWKEIVNVWRGLMQSLAENKPLPEEISKWSNSARDELVKSKWEENRKAFLGEDDGLVTKELAIADLKALAVGTAQHITQTQSKRTCYFAGPFNGEKPITKTQLELLEKQLQDGKVSKETAAKIKSALGAYNSAHWGNVPSLNKPSALLIAKLLGELGIDEAELRISEIKKTKEWKEYKKIWGELDALLKENKPLTDELKEWSEKANKSIKWDEFRKREQQKEDAPLMDLKDALKEVHFLTADFAGHIRMMTSGKTCYERMEMPKAELTEAQLQLLEEQFKAGKIEKPLYEKIKRSIEAFKDRGTAIAKGLNKKNTELIFRLIKEISEPEKVEEKKK